MPRYSELGQAELPFAAPSPGTWIEQLLNSPVFVRQLKKAGRAAPAIDTIRGVLAALDERGGTVLRQALAQKLGIERRLAHRAGDDVRVLSELFEKLVAELRPVTPRDLWHVRVGQNEARPDVLLACRVLAESQQIAEIHYRPSHRRPRNIRCVLTRVRTDLDPPRVMGYALPDRGRFELRADRILWAGTPLHPDSHSEAP